MASTKNGSSMVHIARGCYSKTHCAATAVKAQVKHQPTNLAKSVLIWPDHFFCFSLWWQKKGSKRYSTSNFCIAHVLCVYQLIFL